MSERITFDAVVLAGGRGSRLGGVDKAALRLEGERLVDRALQAALAAGAERLIAVGPPHVGTSADRVVREDPSFSGPLAALEVALTEVCSPWVLLLACDLVSPVEIAERLATEFETLPTDVDGLILVDGDGQRQWLAAGYRSGSLRAALEQFGGTEGKSLRAVLGRLRLRELRTKAANYGPRDGREASPGDINTCDIDTRDIDTHEQFLQANEESRREHQ